MKTYSTSIKFVLLAALMLVIASLACTFDSGNENEKASIQQTQVAIQLTQIALENSVQDKPAEPVVTVELEPQPPVEEIPEITEEVPEEPPDVVYEGISFSFDPQVSGGIIPATIPGQTMGEDYMPSETYPSHYEFSFSSYAVLDHFHTPKILIYPVNEFRTISTYASDIIDRLQQILISKPGGASMSDFPHLPMWNAAQIFASKVTYFDFKNGSGVRFLTMYGQDVYPVDNQNMIFTYQGLTSDGRYYISANLPVTNFGLPFDGASVIGDYMTFHENWDTYIADTIAWLEAQDPANFFPNLAQLDAMMASFEINR